ncbi:MAG: UDP-3-O-[3-hydroxymyristoyl] glucosamine N-acyltransferase [Myxococcota bacterium]|jgi:UDP-3-O-[3-hydroxymyristoyl] glucosamine N-acyltransferase
MNRWLILFVAGSASSAHAEDLNANGCNDAFEGNSACVSETASVDATTTVGASSQVGDGAFVGAELALGSNVTISNRATLAGRVDHVQSPLPVGNNVIVGRTASIGVDASLAADTVVGRSVNAGERLTTGIGAQIGYAAEIGDDVTLGSNAIIGNLARIGTYADVGPGAVIARSVSIEDALAPEDGAQVDGVVGPESDISQRAIVASGARVRKQSIIGEGAMILGSARVGRNVNIGMDATIEGLVRPNATILPMATVEAGATVQRGATVCAGATVPAGEVVATVYPEEGCFQPTSCLDIWTDDNGSADGVYGIDPDGTGPNAQFDAYCDMANGGWTLALRSSDSGDTFKFLSSHWTTTSTLNPTSLDPETNSDAKFPAFNEVEGLEIRGCLKNLSTGVYGCKSYDLPGTQTLLQMFTNTPIGSRETGRGYFFTETSSEKLQWITMWGRNTSEPSSNPLNYQDTGINIDDDQSNYRARVRFGLALNNESNIYTLNDTVGFGASAYLNQTVGGLVESDWRVGTGAAFGATQIHTAGQIWVR